MSTTANYFSKMLERDKQIEAETVSILADTELLAKSLIAEHLGSPADTGWSFEWDKRLRTLGRCSYSRKTIYLSKHWVQAAHNADEAEILDTILHEIAHAIAGYRADHGLEWQLVAIRLGASPNAKYTGNTNLNSVVEHTYEMVDTSVFPPKIVKRYYRKPSYKVYNRISFYFITGRKKETQGKIIIRKVGLTLEDLSL